MEERVMKRKLVKMLTVACVAAIAASAFVGCGNKEEHQKIMKAIN
ncbi:hypothetical protein [Clostridium perfringens]|nr:hypothetical protein [Clostridium perfringens]